MTTKRTTHRSTAGKKLYAVHAKDGKPKDVQTFKRSSRQDQQVTTVEEATRVLVAKARAFKRTWQGWKGSWSVAANTLCLAVDSLNAATRARGRK